ncbi:DNA-3-methyladenine glycosylase [Bacillus sp. 31A1R]|uniref:DNA-3-methyladenine glycosylase II n=1 Tax=Robertmurraya mangrovi TaxID=3098077 RepID=A0ABU5J2A4_9BACI|nr:DNA-3-methyladenine glycosylase [Bacillus sp. 31A1R]MDZ5473550.1 DNA-3-methyladenine glycosylase [Bacillus sp. 31A1R]
MEKINIAGPYNFDLVLDRLSLDPLHALDKEKRVVKVPITVGEASIVATVRATGTTNEPQFIIDGIDMVDKEQAVNKLTHIFQWNNPLEEVHSHFEQTDLKDISNQHRGTPLVLDFHPYNCLMKCIVHQQLNLSFAHTLTERFVKTFGSQVDGVYFYPTPEKVATLTVEDLRALQFSGRKAEYVIGIAKEVVEGRLDIEGLYTKSDEEVLNELIKIRGVGPWTVQNFLMFGLGRPNLFPLADIGLQNALKKLYNLENKPTKEQMLQYTKDWEPYLSYASLYLWRSIE